MQVKIEPLFFKPIYKETIWGGNKIAKEFNRNIDDKNIGESWELSAHENDISYLLDSDVNLLDLFNDLETREQIFGTKCNNMKKFPILVKFIDANQNLSIQVHPNDLYAMAYEKDSGKNEVWYIMNTNDDASIIYGLNKKIDGVSKEEIINNIMDYVNYQRISKEDFITIPAGTIHSILAGTLLCEIQQNSDITYRVYDWNRVDSNGNKRELHKEKAIDVIDENIDRKIINCHNLDNDNIYQSNNFLVDIISISDKLKLVSNPNTFFFYVVVDGKGLVKTNSFSKDIEKGVTFLIPGSLGEYELIGKMKLLKIYL